MRSHIGLVRVVDRRLGGRLTKRAVFAAGALVLSASLLTACGGDGKKPTASSSRSAALSARLDEAIQRVVREIDVPGAIVGVSIPGELDYAKGFGTSDTSTGVPMSAGDYVRIASVTKTYTGTAILQLVDRGLVSLSDPVSKYVPGVPSGDKITLDMLGRMRSGLFPYTSDEPLVTRMLGEFTQGPLAGTVTSQQLLDASFAHPLNFEPGTNFEYSNTNTVLLGVVVEKVTGQPLVDYFQQHIFDPLKLASTSYPSTGDMPSPYVHGYTKNTLDGQLADSGLWNPSWANAAGAIVSTYADTKIWALDMAKGSLLKPETQQARLDSVKADEPGVHYGFAMFDNHGWVGHNGAISGYTTVVVALPDRDATLVVVVNSDIPEKHAATTVAQAVTEIVTPNNVYTQR